MGRTYKRISAVISCLCVICLIFASCEINIKHVHTFSDDWTCDPEYHWHAATCSHTAETKDKQAHTFNEDGVCTVCNYTLPDEYVFYTVTFDANGGLFGEEETLCKQYSKNSSLGETVAPERLGYIFCGWSRHISGLIGWDDSSDRVTGDLTLYAVWQRQCTLVFDARGGKFADGSGEAELKLLFGESVGQFAEPFLDGYNFTGWFTDPSCGEDSIFDLSRAVADDATLYAGWEKIYRDYTVTYDYNYGGRSEQRTIGEGDCAPYISLSRAGYVFCGWYSDAEASAFYDFSSAVEGEFTLYAGWHEITANGENQVADITSSCNSPTNYISLSLSSAYDASYAKYICFAAPADGVYTLYFRNGGAATAGLSILDGATGEVLGGLTFANSVEWLSTEIYLYAGEAVYVKAYNADGAKTAVLYFYVSYGDMPE